MPPINSSNAPPATRPRILLLSAYDAGSHARWREELAESLPDYEWHSLILPPRHFRWRIRGNPLSWLYEPLLDEAWDALVVTTMVDLATLRGLKPALATVPALAYCHENQFVYPQSAHAYRSIEPQMVNLYTVLSAERVIFNSEWNQESFLAGVDDLLARLPDKRPASLREMITAKSRVIPVPVRDEWFLTRERGDSSVPHLVWNHRWEHDKSPDRLLLLLQAVSERGFAFRLSVVGEQFRSHPEAFSAIQEAFSDSIVDWGYQSVARYRQLLAEADLVVSTALHDFQGLSTLEAMAAGCCPWAPNRLAYPEYVPAKCLYRSWENDPLAEAKGSADGLIALWQAVRAGAFVPAPPVNYRSSRLLADYRHEFEQLFSRRDVRVSFEGLVSEPRH